MTVVNLDRPGTTLIVGENLDNTSNGQGANGVGKSTLINAVAYAIYDKPVSNISKDNLVNNINKKNMEVTVEFVAPNGNSYRVHRTRKMKSGAAGNSVYIYEGDKDITPDSAANANKLIEQIVGVTYELFVRIVVFSASHMPFLDLPVKSGSGANQSDIIEELFSLTTLSHKAELLKEVIRNTEVELKMMQVRIETREKDIERHNQQIESAKRRVVGWEDQRQTQLAALTAQLEEVQHIDFGQQQTYHEALAQVTKQRTEQQRELRPMQQRLKEASKQLVENERALEHLRDTKCPFCLQQYQDAASKIGEHESTSVALGSEIEDLQTKIASLEITIAQLMSEATEIESEITIAQLKDLMELKQASTTLSGKIEELAAANNPLIETLDELEAMSFEPINYDDINKVTRNLEHQKFLLKLLTKKDSFVRKALLNKNIPYLNGRLQHYLSLLGLPHTVEFTHEMTASITQFGQALDFGNLSAGQKARVNLALSFAFRDVLQSLHTHINICMLDEVLDIGLDTIGVQAAARMIRQKSKEEQLSLYVISHRDEVEGAFDHTMTIQLSQGFSYVKEG